MANIVYNYISRHKQAQYLYHWYWSMIYNYIFKFTGKFRLQEKVERTDYNLLASPRRRAVSPPARPRVSGRRSGPRARDHRLLVLDVRSGGGAAGGARLVYRVRCAAASMRGGPVCERSVSPLRFALRL